MAKGGALGRALLLTAVLRGISVVLEWWVSATAAPSALMVIGVTCLEHLLGGALTTVLFALMMRHSERDVGATHFTLLASIEVWGKLPLGALSGVIAQSFGYPALFAAASILCVAFALLVLAVRARLDGAPEAATPLR